MLKFITFYTLYELEKDGDTKHILPAGTVPSSGWKFIIFLFNRIGTIRNIYLVLKMMWISEDYFMKLSIYERSILIPFTTIIWMRYCIAILNCIAGSVSFWNLDTFPLIGF